MRRGQYHRTRYGQLGWIHNGWGFLTRRIQSHAPTQRQLPHTLPRSLNGIPRYANFTGTSLTAGFLLPLRPWRWCMKKIRDFFLLLFEKNSCAMLKT